MSLLTADRDSWRGRPCQLQQKRVRVNDPAFIVSDLFPPVFSERADSLDAVIVAAPCFATMKFLAAFAVCEMVNHNVRDFAVLLDDVGDIQPPLLAKADS